MMKTVLIIALEWGLLAASIAPTPVRYHCRMNGMRNQPACCCQGPDAGVGIPVARSAPPDTVPCASRRESAASCGCCDVTYEDERLDAVASGRVAGPWREISAWTVDVPVTEPSVITILPATAPAAKAGTSDTSPPDAGRPRRHLLHCSFLC
jgi:hypothetical protein